MTKGVSVLIPTRNRARSLRRAITSAMAQTAPQLEILISDNASTDDTRCVVGELMKEDDRIVYYRHDTNLGPVANWRTCLEKASADYACILCDDDYFLDVSYLQEAIGLMEGEKLGLVFADVVIGRKHRVVTHLALPQRIDGKEFFSRFWTYPYNIPSISVVFRRDLALACDAFTCENALYGDVELWLKIMLLSDIGFLPLISLFYTFHESNIVENISLDEHANNIAFIDRVRQFAEGRVARGKLMGWYRKMVDCYIFDIVANECVRNDVPTARFVGWARTVGRRAGYSYSKCLAKYTWKKAKGRVRYFLTLTSSVKS